VFTRHPLPPAPDLPRGARRNKVGTHHKSQVNAGFFPRRARIGHLAPCGGRLPFTGRGHLTPTVTRRTLSLVAARRPAAGGRAETPNGPGFGSAYGSGRTPPLSLDSGASGVRPMPSSTA
jgi:hypothetical protein